MADSDDGGGGDGLIRDVRDERGATVLKIVGSIDFDDATGLRNGLLKVVRERSPKKLVADVSGVPYMGSAGVAAFVEALKAMRQNGGGKLYLAALKKEVRAVLEIGRLDQLFHPVDSVDAAIADGGEAPE